MQLVKITELARRSGVSVATLKHYLREGLIAPARRSGRTMSWYDPTLATRIRAIKELQKRQFLPLQVIREALDKDAEATDDVTAADAIAKVLARHGGKRSRSRDDLIARGLAAAELDALATMGLASPSSDQRYRGDDLALVTTLSAARRAGITTPPELLAHYLAAVRALVEIEHEVLRASRRAKPGDAARLAERVLVLVHRKLFGLERR
jgi:DNA-binding transcriptional MerR regulator